MSVEPQEVKPLRIVHCVCIAVCQSCGPGDAEHAGQHHHGLDETGGGCFWLGSHVLEEVTPKASSSDGFRPAPA